MIGHIKMVNLHEIREQKIPFIQTPLKHCKSQNKIKNLIVTYLTLSRRRPLSYLRSKSMDWFLYDNGLRLERVK